MKKFRDQLLVLALTLSGTNLAVPSLAFGAAALEEVVVTARRREELLQDVPISIAVFNQRQLDNANVVNSGDLATITPSLSVNQRFGGENTSFAIRGFTQELRTTASVGTYFAEVIAPRGTSSQTSGDGAGPGSFYDLENVQVLKGPQGTLFGRNTTGGAVLITPKKPTDVFEGYAEGSVGNYDMYRTQAVVNIPATDRVKFRLGFDQQQREGYLNNITNIGPNDLANVNYVAGRASMLIDVTDSLQNYTVATYSNSTTNGQPSTMIACDNSAHPAAVLGGFYIPDCKKQLAGQQAAGQNDYYDVASPIPQADVTIEQWQAINHTDWAINDDLTIKNIFSFANLETNSDINLFGTNFPQPNGGQKIFATSGTRPGSPITNQNSLVEELRAEGTALDGALTWQAGAYYENSEPHSDSGAQSPGQIICDIGSLNTANPNDFRCSSMFFLSNVTFSEQGVEYDNRALYTQETYDINDQLSVTGGLRYTWDKTKGHSRETYYKFDSDNILSAPNEVIDTGVIKMDQESDKPTWVTDISYKPTADAMLYAKYSRGYRQGSVNPSGQHPVAGKENAERIDSHGPERVDSYEIGSKNQFEGQFPSTLNVAVFYNDFRDQQLQAGLLTTQGTGSTMIANAGKARIWGVEVEGNVALTDNLQAGLSYTYLNTEVLELEDVSALIAATGATPSALSTTEGEELPYSPENQAVLSLRYLVPVPAKYGDVSVGSSYIYYSDQLAVSETVSPYNRLDDYQLVNLDMNWTGIAGSAFDASLFITNAFDEEYAVYRSGLWSVAGFETSMTGVPRMFGARVRYNFGAVE